MANCKQMLIGGGKTQTPKVRDERIDSVKYWLIVLVIVGHVFMRKEFSEISACIAVWKWIYIFHMPLFIFISGYFSRKKKTTELPTSIWKLLEPLIIFQTIILVSQYTFNGSISLKDVITPWYALWYLLSLIYWRLLIQIIPDAILNNTKLILPIVFFVGIMSGFLPFNCVLSLQRTLAFMPFFFLGYCMKGKNLFLLKKYKLLCLLFLISIFSYPLLLPQYVGSLTHSEQYGTIYGLFSRIVVFSLSIPMSIAFINICPNSLWISRQGKLTMQYYIYHALAITILMPIVSKLNISTTFSSAVIYSLLLIIIIYILSYLPNFTKFTNPSSFLKK